MGKLIIVSNRLPITVTRVDGVPAVTASSGGLVSAMNSFLEKEGSEKDNRFEKVVWVGYPGCNATDWKKLKNELTKIPYELVPIFMRSRVYNDYYNGFSNSTLWPLFHYFPSYTEYSHKNYVAYTQANRLFAETILKIADPGDTIWVHDYHLMLLPAMLREQTPEASIGFFLHIPFPSYEVFRIMPKKWREELILGIASADLVGFHTNDYVMHYLKTVQMLLGYTDDMRMVYGGGRISKAEVFPISIDFHKFNNALENPKVIAKREEFRELFGNMKIMFSVDRLDYTKGVINRLRAYQRFLEIHPEYREKVVFILVTIPSRDAIGKYSERRRSIQENVGYINGKYGTISWQPVIYRYTSLSFEELSALYTGCDLALITPLRDGMNLVAKEFVASRSDLQGVLLLSEMAGAVSELGEALVINPMDENDVAEKIQQGLEMSAEEQARRLSRMRNRIMRYDVRHWANDFLRQLKQMKQIQNESQSRKLGKKEFQEISRQYSKATRRILFLDYDGSLVRFAKHPLEARPSADLLQLLKRLCDDERNTVIIISGRDNNTLAAWFGHLNNINWVAEHGALIQMNNEPLIRRTDISNDWQIKAMEIMENYTRRCDNTFVERKEYSLAWHYRMADKELGNLRAKELYYELNTIFRNRNLQVIQGNRVIEARNLGTDKGSVVREIIADGDYDFVMAVGDDRTDEDMFRALELNSAWTIKVGEGISAAHHFVPSPDENLELLRCLADISERLHEQEPEHEKDTGI